jgi:hypothetical protein
MSWNEFTLFLYRVELVIDYLVGNAYEKFVEYSNRANDAFMRWKHARNLLIAITLVAVFGILIARYGSILEGVFLDKENRYVKSHNYVQNKTNFGEYLPS